MFKSTVKLGKVWLTSYTDHCRNLILDGMKENTGSVFFTSAREFLGVPCWYVSGMTLSGIEPVTPLS